ncbi:uncharacterized protein LOC121393902 [Xenopus laevis]|uniref:Uncharacterized protein LOC121393902 n=1 Tax=Xenopus laevis TaxID=8355 RepID=A0A8J1KQU9_XENLA|nr:uncharacterized protein LOC121393902 [Xenopus laevis]
MSQPTTQEIPLTFAYSEIEANRIIQQNKGNSSFLQVSTDTTLLREIEREKRKWIGLDLHAITLTEYYKVGRIPRGLRVNLRPTIFKENKDFSQKYERIINKCSFDIILLNIEFLQHEILESSKHIEAMSDKLRECSPIETYRAQLRQMEENLDKHRREIEERKRSKFRRDESDYSSGQVYSWQRTDTDRRGAYMQLRRIRRRHQQETSDQRQRDHSEHGRDRSTDSVQTDTSAQESSTSASFLELGNKKYTRRKGEEGDTTDATWDKCRQPERQTRTQKRH